ncbi:MAG: hypothetical protein ABL914_05790 [Novosphingobium sp.]|uniref:hypothetical protein n=1 Tax=Novosphingobium sp. TaxID=1874826 RepID=UPI0032B8CE4C
MRSLPILTAMAVLLAAPPVFARERQHVCFGQATGALGERVDVNIYLTPGGHRVATTASWDPPMPDIPERTRAAQPDLAVSFLLAEPTATGIGPIGDGLLMVAAFSPPGKRGPAPARQLEGLTAEISFDAGPAVRIALSQRPGIENLPMTASRSAVMPTIPMGAQIVTIRLVDHKRRPVMTARYDISGNGDRTALFNTAWLAAESAAMHPESCELTTEGA